jgi:hypothetical protein
MSAVSNASSLISRVARIKKGLIQNKKHLLINGREDAII